MAALLTKLSRWVADRDRGRGDGADGPSLALLARNNRFGRELLAIALILAGFFAGLDWLVGRYLWDNAANDAGEPQSAAMLQRKLDTLAGHRGLRVALIGDSVILGQSLKEHGDADWQNHTLPSILQKRFDAELPAARALVMNLAFNGALPCDLALVGAQLAKAKPDLVIADIGLRAFSADFAQEKDAVSRSWLFDFPDSPPHAGKDPVENRLRGALMSGWKYYGVRDQLQQDFLGGTPAQLAGVGLARAQAALKPPPPADPEFQQMHQLMLAKRRFGSIHFRPEHAQCQGLTRLLETARDHNWKFLLFYTRENPSVRDELLAPDIYGQRRRELYGLLEPYLGRSLRYDEGETDLPAEHYLDQVHVDAAGYRRLLDTLWPTVRALSAGQ